MANFAPLPIKSYLAFGNYGVMFFFILSGFVLTWSANAKTSPQTFWWRRFARIYPSHLVALVIAIPVFYSFDPDPSQWWVKPVSVGVLLLSVPVLQGWSTNSTVFFSGNPAAWTLSCEAFFYAVHPLLNRALRRLGLRGAILAAVAIFVADLCWRVVVTVWPSLIPFAIPAPISRLSEFVLGMCAAQAMRSGWRPTLPPLLLYIVTAAFAVWAVRFGQVPGLPVVGPAIRSGSNEVMIALCVALIVAIASRDLRGGFSILRWLPLVKLGEWSFAFYLVHATVIYIVLSFIAPRQASWWNLGWTAALLVIALGAAAALHYAVERPCERRLRSWWDARLARRQSVLPLPPG